MPKTLSNDKLNKTYQEAEKLRMINWEDLKTEQQIERMRGIVTGLQLRIQSISGRFERLSKGFEKHSHSDGKIVVEYDKYDNGGAMTGCSQKSAVNFF